MKKRIYMVKQAVWGADRSETLYFPTKKEADEYVKEHEYCDYAGYVCRIESERNKMMAETAYLLNR